MPVEFGAGKPLFLIAGPCVIESKAHVHFLAREIRRIAGDFIFKASFDKANRSSVQSYRGPASTRGSAFWPGCAQTVSKSSQTSTKPGRRSARPKPSTSCRSLPFCVVKRIACSGGPDRRNGQHQERSVRGPRGHAVRGRKGSLHGQQQGPVNRTRLVFRLQQSRRGHARPGHHARSWRARDLRCDAQRAITRCRRPASGGQPQFIEPLASAAVATGAVDGLFVEVHEDPSCALSDGANALPLDRLPGLLRRLQEIFRVMRSEFPL